MGRTKEIKQGRIEFVRDEGRSYSCILHQVRDGVTCRDLMPLFGWDGFNDVPRNFDGGDVTIIKIWEGARLVEIKIELKAPK